MRLNQPPTLAVALVPVGCLIAMLAAAVALFGDASSSGPNQIALMLGTGLVVLIGLARGHSWSELEAGISRGITVAIGAILILLVVGAVIGAWILAGVVPTMIAYGLAILTPSVFYAAACLICAVASLATGSSWTTAGTIGLALIGVATVQGLNPGLAAGAIVSGAYFGDKLSPLSDTTNLAPAVSGTDLIAHIRHMLWTTVPSFGLALLFFVLAGIGQGAAGDAAGLAFVIADLNAQFVIGPHLLIPMLVVLALVIRRVPAFPALLIGALVGSLFAALFQRGAVLAFVDDPTLPTAVALFKGLWIALFAGFECRSGNPVLDDLLTRGGMASMLPTVWLIITAMMFGAAMETTGLLQVIAQRILAAVRNTASLIAATVFTAFGLNVLAADQYISIVLPGRMFRQAYHRRRLDPKNLSRTLEDAGTVTSVLIPWNTCGAFMAQTLGVSTLTYAPYAVFNLVSPLVAMACAYAQIGITRLEEPPPEGGHRQELGGSGA